VGVGITGAAIHLVLIRIVDVDVEVENEVETDGDTETKVEAVIGVEDAWEEEDKEEESCADA